MARKSSENGDAKRARQRRKTVSGEASDDKSTGTSGQGANGTNGPKVKAKAVFRSFANPTNLAAPLPVLPGHLQSVVPQHDPSGQAASGPSLSRGRSSTSSTGYPPTFSRQETFSGPSPGSAHSKVQYAESSRTVQHHNEPNGSFSHDASYYGHPIVDDPNQDQDRMGPGPGGIFLQQPSPSDVSQSSSKSRSARDALAYSQSLYSDQRSSRQEDHGPPAKRKRMTQSVQSNGCKKQEEEVDPMSLAYYGHLSGQDEAKIRTEKMRRGSGADQHTDHQERQRRMRSPQPCVSDELRDGIERWQRNGIVNGSTGIDDATEVVEEAPPPKPKILLPFFRWFGTTANTPGYRKIKVGVLQDTDVADSDDLTPALAEDRTQNASFAKHEESAIVDQGSINGMPAAPLSAYDGATAAAAAMSAARTPRTASTTKSEHFRSPILALAPSPGSKGDRPPSSATRELFEINRPRYPRRDILKHLVSLFLSHFKPSWCPWIDAEELRNGAENGTLPAILANAVCAVAARFSDRSELRRIPRKSSGDSFSEMAKILIMPLLSFPSMEVIETLILLSYAEFAAGSDSGLWMYVGMALRMAQDLGLQHEASVLSIPNEKHQEKARLLFWAVVGLDRITTFGTGRPVTIRESEIDTALPRMNETSDINDETVIFGHCIRILLLRGRMGELLNRRGQEDSFGVEDRKRALAQMWMELAQSYSSLPSNLHFNVQTFQRSASQNQSPGFVYLHVLFQSTIGLLDRPSLMKKFTGDSAPLLPSFAPVASAAASRTIADILTLGDAFDDRCITASPYLDQLILPAGRSFLAEREAAREALRHLGMSSRPPSRGPASQLSGRTSSLATTKSYAEINLAACQRILHKLQVHWAGASWPLRALEQEAAGNGDEVDPQASDEDAQSAPIRDVEMVLKWAKNKLRSQRKLGESAANTAANTPRYRMIKMPDGQEVQQPLTGTSDSGPTSTHSGDSPFGLGLGISADLTFDIDALMGSWQVDEGFEPLMPPVPQQSYNSSAPPYADASQPQYAQSNQELARMLSTLPRRSGAISSLLNAADCHGGDQDNGNGHGGGDSMAAYAAPTPSGILPGNIDISGMAVAEFFSSDQSIWPLQLQGENIDDNFSFLASALQLPHQ
ncbi:hypothetical protein ACQY0O_003481 [Thecaphora frezii]